MLVVQKRQNQRNARTFCGFLVQQLSFTEDEVSTWKVKQGILKSVS